MFLSCSQQCWGVTKKIRHISLNKVLFTKHNYSSLQGLFLHFQNRSTNIRNDISRNNQYHGSRTPCHTDLTSTNDFGNDHEATTSTSQHTAVHRNTTLPSPSRSYKYVFPNRYSHHNPAHIPGLSIRDKYAANGCLPNSAVYV